MPVSQARAKRALRVRMRALREAVTGPERTRLTTELERRLLAVPEFAAARTVLLFYSFGSEVPTKGVADRVLAAGKRLLLPYLDEKTMEAAEILPGETLVQTPYGPKEPSRRAAVDPHEVDVVVTPGLAFDRQGHRLGYGRGFYDQYLSRLRPAALRIGIGFSVQVVDEVPAGPSDERVHMVITDAEAIDCRPGAGGNGPAPL
jgi:5-formyltetrahydrofolate cyclo-ligase